jgi:hypothetical protein
MNKVVITSPSALGVRFTLSVKNSIVVNVPEDDAKED